jgi:hypothetical protein
MLLVALASGAVQIKATAIQVPVGPIKIPAPAIEIRSGAVGPFIGGTQRMNFVQMESSAERNSQPGEFHWAATMHDHQTVEVHLGHGSIQVLPSRDDTVRVQAHTYNPRQNAIQAVSTSSGVKFCDVVTKERESRNYCEPDQNTSQIHEDQPGTKFVIYVPAGVRFFGSTIFGDITTDQPSADTDMATVKGNITFELAPDKGASFKGNVIEGAIDSDFPLADNTPTLPTGERPTMNAPRIVHGIVGAGGPRLAATVVNGNIRLRRSAE